MATKRKSFLLHIDSLSILDELTDEQAGKLFKAIKSHQCKEEMELDAITKIAFSPFKNQFLRDDEKYEETCKARAEAGSKGGKQKVANASKSKQKVAIVADSDSKNKSDSDSDSKSEKPVSPSLDYSSWPSMPSDQLMKDWRSLRTKLKATVTQTVINRTGKELHKAVAMGFTVDQCFEHWIYKGWRGFEAEWMASVKVEKQPEPQKQVDIEALRQKEIEELMRDFK